MNGFLNSRTAASSCCIADRRPNSAPASKARGTLGLHPFCYKQERGAVISTHGGWVYPDTNAHGRGENPQHLYTVAFDGAELWGADAEPGVVVHLDLFEPYLERSDD